MARGWEGGQRGAAAPGIAAGQVRGGCSGAGGKHDGSSGGGAPFLVAPGLVTWWVLPPHRAAWLLCAVVGAVACWHQRSI